MRPSRANHVIASSVLILIALALSPGVCASEGPSQPAATYFKAPLRFEPNQGQSVPGVDFVSHGKGFVLHLSSTGAVFALPKEQMTMQLAGSNPQAQGSTMDPLESKVNYFIGTDPANWLTEIPTFGEARYKDIYPGIDMVYYGNGEQLEYDFVVSPGADPSQIALTFPEARKLRVDRNGDLLLTGKYGTLSFHKPTVYQQIDGRRHQITGSYAISNGGVRFDVGPYDSREPLAIDPTLHFASYLGGSAFDEVLGLAADPSSNAYVTGLTQSSNFPVLGATVYQSSLSGATAGFLTKINSSGNIVFSTYFGGTDSGSNTQGSAIALDSTGNIYVTGITDSNALPTKGGNGIEAQKGASSSSGPVTAISAFTSDSNWLQVSAGNLIGKATTGGSGTGLTVNLRVTGSNGAGTFGPATFLGIDNPGTGYKVNDTITVSGSSGGIAHFTVAQVGAPGGNETAAFVTEFSSSGGLLNSTYVAGTGNTACPNGVGAHGIAVDASGNVYITGFTDSSLLSGMGSPSCVGAFVVSLNFNATGIFKWGQLFGGTTTTNTGDAGNGATVDPSGNVIVTGSIYTSSTGSNDVFVAKLKPADGTSIYSVTEGGSGTDVGTAIAVDASGNAYVAGYTLSPGASFITTNTSTTTAALQPNYAGGSAFGDGLVLKFTSNGVLSYGSYLGGTSEDYATGIGLDAKGNVSIVGSTQSTDFPITPASTLAGANGTMNSGGYDGFIARFNPAFTTQFYAAYLGGSGADFATGVAVAPTTTANNTFIGGYTASANFASKTRSSTTTTGFVAMITDSNPAQLNFTVAPTTNTPAGSVMTPNVQVTIADSTGAPVTSAKGPVTIAVQSGPPSSTVTGATATASNGVATFNALSFSPGGNYTVIATDAADGLATSPVSFTIIQPVLCFTAAPVSTAAGYPMPDIIVTAKNGSCTTGSTITQMNSTITLSVSPSGPTVPATASSGVAKFSGLVIASAGTYTFTASATGSSPAMINSVTITSPVLCFTVQPVDTPAALTIPAVTVAIESGSCTGGVVAQAGDLVTIAIGSGASSATLAGTKTKNASSGVATFSDLSINTVGTSYTLVASTATLSATSTSFNITKASAVTGIYVTSPNCNALTMSGNAYTDSFDSSLGYAASKSNSHGDVSVVGSSTLRGNSTINGVLFTPHPTLGECKKGNGVDISGHAGAKGGYSPLIPTTFAPPAIGTPGTSDVNVDSNKTLSPGNYGNIHVSEHATLTLMPGTYTINSIKVTGGSQITIAPSGAVTLNVAGMKTDGDHHDDGHGMEKPVDLSGGSMSNASGIPANLVLNYRGTGELDLSGKADSYGVIYAPNGQVEVSGQGDWFGTMVVRTLEMTGKAGIHVDRRLTQ